jgi:hypothetical protein
VTEHISRSSASRSSRSVDRFMILVCTVMVFALCTNYTAAAQNPNLLDQMKGDFSELSNKAASWSTYPATDTDTIALNAYNFELRSDCADWIFDTETGSIEILDTTVLPDPTTDVLPLCLDQAWLNQFRLDLKVVGGYTPLEMYLWLHQNKDDCCEYFCIEVRLMNDWKGACCSEHYYAYRFFLVDRDGDGDVDRDDRICLDSNHYPTVGPEFTLTPYQGATTLDKMVTATFYSVWEGCLLEEQQFSISLVHSDMGDLSYVSPYHLCIR